MIRLEEGVDDQLPVRRVLGVDGAEVAQARHVEERHLAVEAGEVGGDVDRRARRRHDPEQAVALLARQRDEVVGVGAARVERLRVQAMAQLAFEPIRPAVVRADDALLLDRGIARLDQAHAAMSADVEEGAKDAAGVAREQQRHAVVVVGEDVAGGQLARVADDERQRPEQMLDLRVADRRAEVVLDRDARDRRVARLPFEPARRDLARMRSICAAMCGQRRAADRGERAFISSRRYACAGHGAHNASTQNYRESTRRMNEAVREQGGAGHRRQQRDRPGRCQDSSTRAQGSSSSGATRRPSRAARSSSALRRTASSPTRRAWPTSTA